ncbi:multi-sensor signal transduction histidine kinase [Natrialba hulunbeirensis JCM 10989]|uniref:histidine kinase n=1 Tax=Natrialba hulunbeirensis JCM 10989 TaxID=1227493 RepID=L9ZYE4_9EURY|nr:multi-sensor signal transduction histidine kinase [Natrialba hulunbeirensis JCM 10989]
MTPSGDPPPTDGQASPSQVPISLLTDADIAVVQLTPTGKIVATTNAFADQTGYSRAALQDSSLTALLTHVPDTLESILDDETTPEPSATPSTPPTPAAELNANTLVLPIQTATGETVRFEAQLEYTPTEAGASVLTGVLTRLPDAERESESEPGGDVKHSNRSPDDEPFAFVERPADTVEGEKTAPAKAFVALADALSDGIIVLDSDSEIQYANPAVERILGYPPQELVGGSKLSIIPERLRENHLQALERYLETGERNIDWEYVELPGHHADGHEVPLGISLNDFFFGGQRYFVGLFRDISPRKEAEKALREREQQLKQYKEYTDDILNAIDDVFYVLDTDGSLQRWNQRLREVTGYTDDEIESMHAAEFFSGPDRDAITDAVVSGFETGHARVEADVVTKSGTQIPYEFVATTLDDPDGHPVLTGIGRDMTTQREQRHKLEASNERLEQFAYAASHDLQEPLRMVTSYLQLIDQRYSDQLDEDGEEFIAYAVDGAERMREMIDGLLEYSRVDTQGEPLEPVDLDSVLDDVLSDLQLAIEESDAEINAESLPCVAGDRSQLRQVFQNLLSNAIAYSGDESPVIDILVESTPNEDDEMWRLAVADAGVGIEPNETDRVFQVFQRLHGTVGDGTGLGLALTRRIVERHGGQIWVDSEPGEGSTFYVTLPAVDKQESSE